MYLLLMSTQNKENSFYYWVIVGWVVKELVTRDWLVVRALVLAH